MHIFSALLFVVSASLDNLVVGIAYGSKKLRIPILSNILIAFISCIGTFLSMLFGKLLVQQIPSHKANVIGSIILISLGLFFIINSNTVNGILRGKKRIKNLAQSKEDRIEYYSNQYEEILSISEKADIDSSGTIDLREAVTLGVALALNNIGLGIGASITGLSVILTSILILAFSLTALPFGYILGEKLLSQSFKNRSDVISGVIIILLGVYELFI